MRLLQDTLTRSVVRQHAAQLLPSCLRRKDFRPAWTVSVLLPVLFTACSRLCSLSAACRSLATAPARETIRQAVLRGPAERDELLRRPNRAPLGPSGTRGFALRKRGGWDAYPVKAGAGRKARVSIRVHGRNDNGPWNRHGRPTLGYAFWGTDPSRTKWVRETCRQRFAIETSCRQLHQGRARTCTRDPLLRRRLVGVAVVLRNVWVWLHDAVRSTPRRGNRKDNLDRLTRGTMFLWLPHQAEDERGRRDEVWSERPMPLRMGA